MLKLLRKNTKVIIWFIILSFCLWGAFSVGMQVSSSDGQLAGRVFGRPISFQEFNKFLKASEIFSLTGDKVEDPGILEQHAWQNIIFASEAKRRKIKVSDDEVRDEIKRLLAAQNVPSNDTSYQLWVKGVSGSTPRNFEEMVRETLRVQKLLREVQAEPVQLPPEAEIRQQFLLDQRQLAAEAVIFTDPAQAQSFYELMLKDPDWHSKVISPEGPKLENIALQSLRNTALSYALTEQQIQGIYELSKDSVSPPEKTASGRVILFRITDKKEVGEAAFEAEGVAEKYRAELAERKRYDNFLNWHNDLILRSHFESYRQQQ